MLKVLLLSATRIGAPILGVVLPAIIFGISIILTFMLIKHFIKKHKEQ